MKQQPQANTIVLKNDSKLPPGDWILVRSSVRNGQVVENEYMRATPEQIEEQERRWYLFFTEVKRLAELAREREKQASSAGAND